MTKTLWWPQPHNQGLNYIRLKYVFESKEAMINSTTPSLKEVLGDNYDLIIQLYGNLFVAADNKLKAQALWKMGTMKFSGQYLMKKDFNDLSLDTLLETVQTSSSSGSSSSTSKGQGDGYLYNDQTDATEGNRYHSDGQVQSGSSDLQSSGSSSNNIKSYNISKVQAIIELATTAESELIFNMINWIVATVQPDITQWGVEVKGI